ncbi:MAG: hypothetical protein V7607_3393 [Solirubrobacteraceae bacterium]
MILAHRSWGDPGGPLALFLHGAACEGGWWGQAASWFAARGWHAVALDLPGHGASPPGDDRLAPLLPAVGDDVANTVEALRPGDAVDVLVASSLGSVVGLACVAHHPLLARRLVLEDPPGRASVDAVQLAREVDALVASARRDPLACAREHFAGAPVVPDEAALTDWALALAAVDLPTITALVLELAETDMEALLASCPVPALMLLGRDRRAPLGSIGETTITADMRRYSTVAGAERTRYAGALAMAGGQTLELPAGHAIHQSAFGQWAVIMDRWLASSDHLEPSNDVRPRSPGRSSA